jgi:hypothetical protein
VIRATEATRDFVKSMMFYGAIHAHNNIQVFELEATEREGKNFVAAEFRTFIQALTNDELVQALEAHVFIQAYDAYRSGYEAVESAL